MMQDDQLLQVFLDPLRKCLDYTPAFGQTNSDGVSFDEFQGLYGADPLYAWLGLNSAPVYSAHKAAGGLTSVYRQLGVGCERIFRQILMSSLSLSDEQVSWSYEYEKGRGKIGIHTLDARVDKSHVSPRKSDLIKEWIDSSLSMVGADLELGSSFRGAVFEVRQGYKSADSKRQNADLRFGVRAYQSRYLPVLSVISTQVSNPVIQRYRSDGLLVLTGELSSDPTSSTFAFLDQVIGYDLPAFFERNKAEMSGVVKSVLQTLLSAS